MDEMNKQLQPEEIQEEEISGCQVSQEESQTPEEPAVQQEETAVPEEDLQEPAVEEHAAEEEESAEEDEPHDKNVKLMSPTRMVVRRFFRSKLSMIGLIMVIGLFIFSFFGPVVYTRWGETQQDRSGTVDYASAPVSYTAADGKIYEMIQVAETEQEFNKYAGSSKEHLLGTDGEGHDIFVRLMYGGRVSLIVSFLAVFLISILGVIMGGISGFFGGIVDNIIMRLCDILMCLPGVPILLIIHTILEAMHVDKRYIIYLLMIYLTFISWPGTARLVRGQILSLREQEYMVAAEAMGYSTGRKIFKHLVPNVMPQLIVQMSLSLGSMILYEATLSYLQLGVPAPYAAWGSMINSISGNSEYLALYPQIWIPAGVCIVIAVLGFNFVGDGLRDALDPKARR